jgi:hypothetical protein
MNKGISIMAISKVYDNSNGHFGKGGLNHYMPQSHKEDDIVFK